MGSIVHTQRLSCTGNIMSAGDNEQVGHDDEDGGCGGFVGTLIWLISMLLICCTFPFSLFVTVKQVQEYQRAVIFRLGRVKRGGAVGPGLFFIIPSWTPSRWWTSGLSALMFLLRRFLPRTVLLWLWKLRLPGRQGQRLLRLRENRRHPELSRKPQI